MSSGERRGLDEAGAPVAAGFETRPDAPEPLPPEPFELSLQLVEHPYLNVHPAAAEMLVDTVFGGTHHQIPRLRYATAYKLAEGRTGGDIIDVFHYDNDHVSLAVADIAGKGPQAAVHAAMIKYGLRAYVSNGSTPETTIRALDRLYLENNAHEKPESFATVFLGIVDDSRRSLHYTNAAMECALLVHPDGQARWLSPTAPLVGVFDDQHHLFKQQFTPLMEGSLLVIATDGVTEARNRRGQTFGCARILQSVLGDRDRGEAQIAEALLSAVESFADARRRDDIAIMVLRFL